MDDPNYLPKDSICIDPIHINRYGTSKKDNPKTDPRQNQSLHQALQEAEKLHPPTNGPVATKPDAKQQSQDGETQNIAWGKEVNGVQCCLIAEKNRWKMGETPEAASNLFEFEITAKDKASTLTP